MAKQRQPFMLCVKNDGYAARLQLRNLYRVIADRKAAAENLIRVIDDSGEDHLYPQGFFASLVSSPKSWRERMWGIVSRLDPFAKPASLQTQRDFQRYPIWEFATDTEHLPWRDETWVRPVRRSTIPWDEYSLIVAATITVASGQRFDGEADVSTVHGKLDVPMGTLFTEDEWLDIPNPEQFRAREKRARLAAVVGQPLEAIYPIRWTLKVLMEGETELRSGIWSFPENSGSESKRGWSHDGPAA